MSAAVGFWWEKDSAGYEIDASREHIIALGGKAKRYWLEGAAKRVFEDLANCKRTPEHALAFTRQWGFLLRPHIADGAMSLGELGGFYDQQHYVENLLVLAKHKNYHAMVANIPRQTRHIEDEHSDTLIDVPDTTKVSGIGMFTLDVKIEPGELLPRVFIRPASLLSFIVVELMQTIAGAAEVRTCDHCRNIFAISPDVKRRRTKKHCSTRCRVAANRSKKRDEERRKHAALEALAYSQPATPEPMARGPRRRRSDGPPD